MSKNPDIFNNMVGLDIYLTVGVLRVHATGTTTTGIEAIP